MAESFQMNIQVKYDHFCFEKTAKLLKQWTAFFLGDFWFKGNIIL